MTARMAAYGRLVTDVQKKTTSSTRPRITTRHRQIMKYRFESQERTGLLQLNAGFFISVLTGCYFFMSCNA